MAKIRAITAGNGNTVMLRDDLTEDMLDQMAPDFSPHGRYKKRPGQRLPNRNQFGDQDIGVGGIGPGPNDGGIEPEYDRNEWKKWFNDDHDNLSERQQSNGGDGSKPFMSDGSKPDMNGQERDDQGVSPLSYAHDLEDPLAKSLDNQPNRLPGAQMSQLPSNKMNQRTRSTNPFNQIRRLQSVSPLIMTWAHLKKGRAT